MDKGKLHNTCITTVNSARAMNETIQNKIKLQVSNFKLHNSYMHGYKTKRVCYLLMAFDVRFLNA